MQTIYKNVKNILSSTNNELINIALTKNLI